MDRRSPTRFRRSTGAGLLLAAGLLTACSGASSSSSTAGGTAVGDAVAAAPAAASAAAAGAAPEGTGLVKSVGNGAATGSGGGQVAVGQHVIRNVQVTIEVKVLETAAAAVRQAALDVGGFVSSETTGYAPSDPTPAGVGAPGSDTSGAARKPPVTGESLIVLRVPVAKLDDTVKRVTDKLGTVLSRTSSAQDVTGDVADLTSRVATQKASVARVRELLAKAGNLKDVVLIESELSRREADLEALQSRLASLNDRADLSTVTVTLRTPDAATTEPGSSIWEPLRPGWNALVGSFTFLVTLAGALLPFVVVAVLLWWPTRWAWRRWGARPHTGPVAPGPTTGSGPVPPPGR
jgi:hypothetical protein